MVSWERIIVWGLVLAVVVMAAMFAWIGTVEYGWKMGAVLAATIVSTGGTGWALRHKPEWIQRTVTTSILVAGTVGVIVLKNDRVSGALP